MRRFGTEGHLYPEDNYVVPRTVETASFISVKRIGGVMHIEAQTGRGRMDIILIHNNRKYIIETKVWRGTQRHQAGKQQLAAYLKLEGATEGHYIVFDHRKEAEPLVETETLAENLTIRSYVIPLVQEIPSAPQPVTAESNSTR